MKLVNTIIATAALAVSASAAQAYQTGGEGYYLGDATIKSSGKCVVKPVKFENARLGDIYDDEESYIGWGLISAEGDLLALYSGDSAYILYKYESKAQKYTGTYFEDYLSEPLVYFIQQNAECSIAEIYPDTNSKAVYTELNKPDPNEATVSLNFGFDGFVDYVYDESPNGFTYTGGKFSGSVTFKGDLVEPIF